MRNELLWSILNSSPCCSFLLTRQPCSRVGSSWAAALSGNIQLPWCGVLHRLPCGHLLGHGRFRSGSTATSLTVVSSTGCREISSSPGAPPPPHPLISVLALLRLALRVWHFCPFLNEFSQWCCTGVRWAQLWPVVGPLELAVSVTGQPTASSPSSQPWPTHPPPSLSPASLLPPTHK